MTSDQPTPQKLVIKDRIEGKEGLFDVEVTLIPYMKFDQKHKTEDGRWSATFKYRGLRCVLRERKNGAIQCKAKWLGTASGTKSTGTKYRVEAIQWAADKMKERVADEIEAGDAVNTDEPPARTKGLRLSEAATLLRRRGLLPGKPGTKKRAPYELVLDIARAVWDEDPYLTELNKAHIRRMYKARRLPEPINQDDDPDEQEDTDAGSTSADENPEEDDNVVLEDLEPFEWPPFLSHRRPIGRVKPQTVQGDLLDLKTALGKLVGETDAQNRKYLVKNPLDGLELGSHEKDRRDQAGPRRYEWVLRYADEAVERIRNEGYKYKERRTYKGEKKSYNRTQILPDIVPGLLRYMLVLQFGHPTRPKSIRHIRMSDTARTRFELVSLVGSLDLKTSDDPIGLGVVDIWPHGGIAYRRRWSKNNTERLVPHSVDTAAEHDRYIEKRARWLEELGVTSPWLFPSPRDPRKPIGEKDAGYLLALGEEVAREKVREAGLNPKEIVPDFHGTAWYAYRKYWKTNRNAMGWEGNSNAAYVGDWTTKDGAIADVVYAQFSPHLVLAVVEGKTLLEALKDEFAIEEAKRSARVRPDVEDGVVEEVSWPEAAG